MLLFHGLLLFCHDLLMSGLGRHFTVGSGCIEAGFDLVDVIGGFNESMLRRESSSGQFDAEASVLNFSSTRGWRGSVIATIGVGMDRAELPTEGTLRRMGR